MKAYNKVYGEKLMLFEKALKAEIKFGDQRIKQEQEAIKIAQMRIVNNRQEYNKL